MTLHYEIEGAGSPIVLVNPGALDCRIWEPQRRAFSKSHRVLRYDPRGWGKSERVDAPFSHLGDLRELLDLTEIPRAHLVGSSFGGSLALDFAAAVPERVASAVLVGAGGPQNGFPPPSDLARTFAPIFEAMKENFARGIDVWLELDARMPREAERRALVRENALANQSFWEIPSGFAETLTPPVSGRLAEMSLPALLVVGEHDHPYAHQIAEIMEKGLPRARRVVVEGAGHLVHLDRAEKFNELVLDFVDEIDSAG